VDWRASTDKDLLRRIMTVDVAGNVAEMLHPAGRVSEGRLSGLYNDRTPGDRPSDFIFANETAARLASVLSEKAGSVPVGDEFWQAKRSIMEQAETEVEQILQHSLETLNRLARELQRGPMTGTDIRLIMER